MFRLFLEYFMDMFSLFMSSKIRNVSLIRYVVKVKITNYTFDGTLRYVILGMSYNVDFYVKNVFCLRKCVRKCIFLDYFVLFN